MRDPMEGTPDDVPRHECAIHGYRADDYPCPDCDDVNMTVSELFAVELGPAAATAEVLAALHRALDRVRRAGDEQTGRDLAARFDTGGER